MNKITERGFTILSIVIGLVSLVAIPLSLVPIFVEKPPNDEYILHFLIVYLCFGSITIVMVIGFLLWIINKQANENLSYIKKITQLEIVETQALAIATLFTEMSRSLLSHEVAVDQFLAAGKVIEHPQDARDLLKTWDAIAQKWTEANVALSNTVAHSISIRNTGDDKACVANIKYISQASEYKVQGYSMYCSGERKSYDAIRGESKINDYKLYEDLLAMSEDTLIIPDIEKYLEDHRNYRSVEEVKKMSQHLQSCFLGEIRLPLEPGQKEGKLIGILCVDSKLKHFFGDEFDKLVVRQILNHASSLFVTRLQAFNMHAQLESLANSH